MTTVDTSQWTRENAGRKPRGRGHWAFAFEGAPEERGHVWWADGSFTEARKAAEREARRRGAATVVVLP